MDITENLNALKNRDEGLKGMLQSQRNLPPSLRQTATRWRNKNELFATFNVNTQTDVTADPNRCFFSNAPALNTLNVIYGRGVAEEWLTYQLGELSEFSGARDKLTPGQLRQMVKLVLGEYGMLNVAEFMLFCRRMKLGRYGTFYGSVDPMAIMRSIRMFLRERGDAREERKALLGRMKIEADSKKVCLSYGEWKLVQYAEAEYAMNTREEDERIELKYKLKKREL